MIPDTGQREVIGDRYGAPYTMPKGRVYKTKTKGAQEAHESIRPVSCAALSLTRSFHVPFATSDEAFTVYVVLMLSAEPPVPYAFSV